MAMCLVSAVGFKGAFEVTRLRAGCFFGCHILAEPAHVQTNTQTHTHTHRPTHTHMLPAMKPCPRTCGIGVCVESVSEPEWCGDRGCYRSWARTKTKQLSHMRFLRCALIYSANFRHQQFASICAPASSSQLHAANWWAPVAACPTTMSITARTLA